MNSNVDPNLPKQPFHAAHFTQPRKRECHGRLKYEQVDIYSSEESSGEEREGDTLDANGQDGSGGQKRRPMSVS